MKNETTKTKGFEGEYYLSVKNGHIHIDNLKDWTNGNATFDTDNVDNFIDAIFSAMKQIEKKQDEVEVGDTVKIVDSRCYPYCEKWVESNIKKGEFTIKYAYGGVPDASHLFKVLAKGNFNFDRVAYLQDISRASFGISPCYVVSLSNLKGVQK